MGLTRSRLAGALLIVCGAVLLVIGVGLFYPPAAVIIAGLLVAALGLSLTIEVRP